MQNCVDCLDPPGGRACCPKGLTPMCFIQDGKAQTHCLEILPKVSRNESQFRKFLVKSIIEVAGQEYASEVRSQLSIRDGFAQFSSRDGYVKVTVQNIATGMQEATF